MPSYVMPKGKKNTNQSQWADQKAPQLEAAKKRREEQNKTKPNNELTTGNTAKDTMPLIKRDAQGMITGVDLPNGDSFNGISADDVQKIVDQWNKLTVPPDNSRFADMTKEKQWAQELADKKAKEDFIASQTPPNVSQKQLQQVGVYNPSSSNDPNAAILTKDILGNAMIRDYESKPYTETGSSVSLIPPINKLAAFAGKLPGGRELIAAMSTNKKTRDYLSDFSNENNFKTVEDNVRNAQTNLRLAIKMANQPGESQEAITAYNDALARIDISIRQLKMIERNDQRAYVDDVKNKRVELENFLLYNVPVLNAQMKNALIKPDPGYYDSEVEKILGEG